MDIDTGIKTRFSNTGNDVLGLHSLLSDSCKLGGLFFFFSSHQQLTSAECDKSTQILTRGLLLTLDGGFFYKEKQSIFTWQLLTVQRQQQLCCTLLTGTYSLSVYVTNLPLKLPLLKNNV